MRCCQWLTAISRCALVDPSLVRAEALQVLAVVVESSNHNRNASMEVVEQRSKP